MYDFQCIAAATKELQNDGRQYGKLLNISFILLVGFLNV